MQKRNLTKKTWLDFMPYHLKKIFYEGFFGKPKMHTFYYYHTTPSTFKYDFLTGIKINILEGLRIKVIQKKLPIMAIMTKSLQFEAKKPDIRSGLDFSYIIKWSLLNFRRIINVKVVNLKLTRPFRIFCYKNFTLKKWLKMNKIDKKMLKFDKFLTINPELKITPYIFNKTNEIYDVPTEKFPLEKFSLNRLFIEALKKNTAEKLKMKPDEFLILNIYENLPLQMFKGIKHNPERNSLLCYFDKKKKNTDFVPYYLILVKKFVTNEILTVAIPQ